MFNQKINVFEPVTNLFEAAEVKKQRDETTRRLIEFSVKELEREWKVEYPTGEVSFGEFVESIHIPDSLRDNDIDEEAEEKEEDGGGIHFKPVRTFLVIDLSEDNTTKKEEEKPHVKTLAEEWAEQPRYYVPPETHSRASLSRAFLGGSVSMLF